MISISEGKVFAKAPGLKLDLKEWQGRALKRASFVGFKENASCDMVCAYRMAKLGKVKRGKKVLDPFGGMGFSGMVLSLFKPELLVLNDVVYAKRHLPRILEESFAQEAGIVQRTEFTLSSQDAVHTNFPDNHFHAIVTSPPYNLGFKSKARQIAYVEKTLPEIVRILSPGGRLVLRVPKFWLSEKPGEIDFASLPLFHGLTFVKKEELPEKRKFKNVILAFQKPIQKKKIE